MPKGRAHASFRNSGQCCTQNSSHYIFAATHKGSVHTQLGSISLLS